MKIEEKISKLTSVPAYEFNNLFTLMSEVYCDEILNGIERGDDSVCVDIGIGRLSFLIEDDTISYKFIPSECFEGMIVNSVRNRKSPLIAHINKGITEKIMEAYKNLM